MAEILKAFNFSPMFQKWVKVLYSNSQSTFFLPMFTKHLSFWKNKCIKDVHSLLIYSNLAFEILAIQIKFLNKIKRIQIEDTEIKISQILDDT